MRKREHLFDRKMFLQGDEIGDQEESSVEIVNPEDTQNSKIACLKKGAVQEKDRGTYELVAGKIDHDSN